MWTAAFLHRHSNVSSQAILPTWVPFRTTILSEEKLVFSLRLMEGKQGGLAEGGWQGELWRSHPCVLFRGLGL